MTSLANHLFTGVNPGPCGAHRDEATPCGIFRARDGFMIVVALAHQWAGMCKLMGKPELATNPRYATQEARNQNKLETVGIIEEWLQTFPTRDEPIRLLQQNHFISAPVLDLPGVLNHPQMKARKTMQTVNVPGFGDIPLPKAPFHFSKRRCQSRRNLACWGRTTPGCSASISATAEQVAVSTGRCWARTRLSAARERSGPDGER
jgi:crotonobetainyl-CoA:carnitine CoA-transferase CaiB-like acyl-CoA transferase